MSISSSVNIKCVTECTSCNSSVCQGHSCPGTQQVYMLKGLYCHCQAHFPPDNRREFYLHEMCCTLPSAVTTCVVISGVSLGNPAFGF